MGDAWVVGLDDIQPKALITVADPGPVAGKFSHGDSLLLRTGWSNHADDPQYYRDKFPRVSEELALWCAAKRVKLLGIEPPSVADVNNLDEVTRIHRILLEAKVQIVEGLTNLNQLTERQVWFVAMPLKVAEGEAAPAPAAPAPSRGELSRRIETRLDVERLV